MTDDRLGGPQAEDPLWLALARLPPGAGVVFRHYGLPAAARRALLAKVAAFARRRRLVLLGSRIGGAPDGVHRPAHQARVMRPAGRALVTASAHNRRELVQAFAAGADLVFLSPAFATRSHPGARTLGPVRFGLAARPAAGPVVALGGMDAARARRLRSLGATGYAGIDCWMVSPGSRARAADR
jgi:thiamine-phosphate pyrophosphorylase